MDVLQAEADVEPGVEQRRIRGGDEDVVTVVARVDPAAGDGAVDVTSHLGLLDGVSGELDPDVLPPAR